MQKHQDHRGFFQELWRDDETSFKQVSWFSIEPGKQRGHHYHKETHELFVLIEGQALAIVGASETSCDLIELKPGDVLKVKPLQAHAFYSEKGAKLLSMSSQHFDPEHPDTYKSQLTLDTAEAILRSI